MIRAVSLLFAALLWSCAADDPADGLPSDPKMQIMLRLPGEEDTETRATEPGSNEENRINSLHLFVFDNSGSKEFDIFMNLPYASSSPDVDMSLWNSEKVIIVLNADILSSLSAARNIHVVANVAAGKLASVTSEASLKAAVTNLITAEIAQPDATHPLVMHGSCQGHVFTSNIRAALTLVRNVAKVRLRVNTTNSPAPAALTFAPGNAVTVSAANVADRSYIVDGASSNPSATAYINYAARTVAMSSSSGATKTFTMPAMYLNENLSGTASYLIIRVPFYNGAETIADNYYKILINEDDGSLVRRNTIYDMTVNINALGGETSHSAPEVIPTINILPWNDRTLVSDMTQTFITVEKTELQVAGGTFNFEYDTNVEASKRIITSSAPSWLTVVRDPQNNKNLKITAAGTGYTTPRQATFDITANDLTKRITVRQAAVPADGSISLSPSPLYLSTASPKNVTLTVPSGNSWTNLSNNASIATYTPASGTGPTQLSFTRGTTAGNAIFRYLNLKSLSYVDLQVCNLSLTSSLTELNVPGEGVTNIIKTGIEALGGDANWVVKSKPTWMTVSNTGGELTYSVEAGPNGQDRTGTIVLNHVNDPDLTVSIPVNQSARFIYISEFDYILLRVLWEPNGQILDSQIEIQGTGIPDIDGYGVGFALSYSYIYDGCTFIEFGGDSSLSNVMTTLVRVKDMSNLPAIRNKVENEGLGFFNIDVYAAWYNTNVYTDPYFTNSPAKVEMIFYKGGEMVIDPVLELWENPDAVKTDTTATGGLRVDAYDEFGFPTYYANYRTESTKLITVKYDILNNDADIDVIAPLFAPTRSLPLSGSRRNAPKVERLPNETGGEYAKRLRQSIRDRNNK